MDDTFDDIECLWDRLSHNMVTPCCHKIMMTDMLKEQNAQWVNCPYCKKRFVVIIEYYPAIHVYNEEDAEDEETEGTE